MRTNAPCWIGSLIIALGLVIVPLTAAAAPGLDPMVSTAVLEQSGAAERLQSFYAARGGEPLWLDGLRPNRFARAAERALLAADRDGLNPFDYADGAIGASERFADAGAAVRWELRLTAAMRRFVADAIDGRLDPAAIDPEWRVPRDAVEPLSLIERWQRDAADGSGLDRLLWPRHPDYDRLRQALHRYRLIAAQGDWPALPDGPLLQPDIRHPQIAVVRERLAFEDWRLAVTPAAATLYDPELAAAVRRFQQRHGLAADGLIGRETRYEMNLTAAARAAQILVNLERWRWLPRELGERFLWVNTAGFQLHLEAHGEVVLRARTISGRPSRSSPSLRSAVTSLVFNPTWSVPRTIAVRDLLPREQREPGYLAGLDFRVFERGSDGLRERDPATIDWQRLSRYNFPYLLRQDPGPQNALGRLKFHLPNDLAIYLHDTPAQTLFDSHERALSSGCIRVEQPGLLAAALLDGESDAPGVEVAEGITSGETFWRPLRRPTPVYLVYFTAWVEADGTVQFRRDLYAKDRPLELALRRHAPERSLFALGVRDGAQDLLSTERHPDDL